MNLKIKELNVVCSTIQFSVNVYIMQIELNTLVVLSGLIILNSLKKILTHLKYSLPVVSLPA